MWIVAEFDATLGLSAHEVDSTSILYGPTSTEVRSSYRKQMHDLIDQLFDRYPEIMDGGHFFSVHINAGG